MERKLQPLTDEDLKALESPEAPVPQPERKLQPLTQEDVEAIEPPSPSLVDRANAVATHALDGVTLGAAGKLLPHVYAAGDKVAATVKGEDSNYDDLVKRREEEWKQQLHTGATADRITGALSNAANFTGKLIPALTTGGASLPGQASLAALEGATQTDKDLTSKGGIAEVAAKTGASLLPPAVVKYGGKAVDALADKTGFKKWIADRAAMAAIKAAGATKADLNGALEKQALDHGRRALDEGLVTFGASAKTIRDRAKGLKDVALPQQQGALNELSERTGGHFDLKAVIKQAREELIPTLTARGHFKDVAKVEKLLKQWEGQANDLVIDPRNSLDFGRANQLKTGLEQQINRNTDNIARQKSIMELQAMLRDNIDDQARAVGPELADQLANANKRYGTGAQIEDLAQDKMNREFGNRFFTPSSYGTGSVAGLLAGMQSMTSGKTAPEAALQAGAAFLGTGLVNKLAVERGRSMQAAAYNAVPKFLETAPDKLGKWLAPLARANAKGPEALQAAVGVLSKFDPQFAEWLAAQDSGNELK